MINPIFVWIINFLMQKTTFLFLIFTLFAIVSCSKKNVPASQNINEKAIEIDEDLSVFRQSGQNEATQSTTDIATQAIVLSDKPLYINDKIDAYLAEKAAKNKNIKYANGYRIQLYVGRERKLVDDAKIYIYQTYPNINPYLTYSLPIYKLKLGDFITRTEAERLLNQLKPLYPEAIIVPEKIDVAKSFKKE
jgi:hypothetical protein